MRDIEQKNKLKKIINLKKKNKKGDSREVFIYFTFLFSSQNSTCYSTGRLIHITLKI